MQMTYIMIFLLFIPLLMLAYGISGLIIAARSKNPVVKWGIGSTAVLSLICLVVGALLIFGGAAIRN